MYNFKLQNNTKTIMPRIDNKLFYLSALKRFGQTPKGLHWNSKQHQEVRFDALLALLPQDLTQADIADIGCGFGDFYLYMLNKGKRPFTYVGVDFLEEMCEITHANTKLKALQADATKDELPTLAYLTCSGTMNTLSKFESYQLIQNCYSTCKEGFIFNTLHGIKRSETYNYLTTKEIKNIAKELHVKKIKFIDGYLEDDITVGFFK